MMPVISCSALRDGHLNRTHGSMDENIDLPVCTALLTNTGKQRRGERSMCMKGEETERGRDSKSVGGGGGGGGGFYVSEKVIVTSSDLW